MRRMFAMFAAVGLLSAMVPSVAAGQPSSGLVYNFQDVRAVWSRSIDPCVDEGVFFGFHEGKDLYRMPGFHYLGTDKIAGVWWWQNDVCAGHLLFFRTGDVWDPPPSFGIDKQLMWAWADVTVPVSDGVTTYQFTFDIDYTATAKPSVRLTMNDVQLPPSGTPPGTWFGTGLRPDPDLYRQTERVAPAVVSGDPTTTIPGGWSGFELVWSEISTFTRVEVDH